MDYSTKFNPGDEVWTMYDNKPHQFTISLIEVTVATPRVRLSRPSEVLVEYCHTAARNNPLRLSFDARNCFATKQELIDHLFNSTNG